MGYNEDYFQGKSYTNIYLHLKRSQIRNLNLHLKNQKKKGKIAVDKNEIENRKITEN